jgi:hypothetical protein
VDVHHADLAVQSVQRRDLVGGHEDHAVLAAVLDLSPVSGAFFGERNGDVAGIFHELLYGADLRVDRVELPVNNIAKIAKQRYITIEA